MLPCLHYTMELLSPTVHRSAKSCEPNDLHIPYFMFASLIHLQEFRILRRDHTPPAGNLPKLQVLIPLVLVFLFFMFPLSWFLLWVSLLLPVQYIYRFHWVIGPLILQFLLLLNFKYCLHASNTVYILSTCWWRTLKSSSSVRISFLSPSQGHRIFLDSLCTALPWEGILIAVCAIGTLWCWVVPAAVCPRLSLGIPNITWPKLNSLLPLWKQLVLLDSHIKEGYALHCLCHCWLFYPWLPPHLLSYQVLWILLSKNACNHLLIHPGFLTLARAFGIPLTCIIATAL